MKRWLICLFLLILGLTACQPATVVPAEIPPAEPEMATLAPPLAKMEFPTEVKAYPTDWPGDLQFSEDFQSVDFGQGTLPEGSKNGWSIKMLYTGTFDNALTKLRATLKDKGWTIVQETDLDSGGKIWITSDDQNNSGLFIIDRQNAHTVSILATFYR